MEMTFYAKNAKAVIVTQQWSAETTAIGDLTKLETLPFQRNQFYPATFASQLLRYEIF